MDQSYPLIRPGPGANPPIQTPFLNPSRRGLTEGRILKIHLFFFLFQKKAEGYYLFWHLEVEVLGGFEPPSLDSKSRVLTTTP